MEYPIMDEEIKNNLQSLFRVLSRCIGQKRLSYAVVTINPQISRTSIGSLAAGLGNSPGPLFSMQ